MAVTISLKGFAVITLIFQIFFGIIYGFHEGYVASPSINDFNGMMSAIFLIMLLLVGFGLVAAYLKHAALSSMMYTFLILAFTIQWYFLMRKFWFVVNLTDNSSLNTAMMGDNLYNIRFANNLHYNNNQLVYEGVQSEFTLSEAVACAISMYVILFPLLGRVGPMQVLSICLVGNWFYALNEGSFWKHDVQDNGYGMRIFLFGSVAGLVASRILGKKEDISKDHTRYYSEYTYQTFGLIGAVFVWILMPWLSVIQQSQNTSTVLLDYRQVAPLNIWFALCSSAGASFVVSIWIRGKIAVHDIVFSCFSGAIAYGASSNVFPNPFPAMLIGFISGIIVTALNATKKKCWNQSGIIDSLGSFNLFLVPSLLGAVYSAILFASGAQGPDNTGNQTQKGPSYSRFGQGGYQLIGMLIAIACGIAAGLLIGVFCKIFNKIDEADELFNDKAYIYSDQAVLVKSQPIVNRDDSQRRSEERKQEERAQEARRQENKAQENQEKNQ